MKKRLFVIDGNYFANRCIFGLHAGGNENYLETETDMINFGFSLKNSFINLSIAIEPLFDSIVFCSDLNSWRKKVEPFKPYFVDNETPIGYKENRKVLKEDSPLNYDNFYIVYNKFVKELKELTSKTNIPVFEINGLEGDDVIMLISSLLSENNPETPRLSNDFDECQNWEMTVFCTDGDLNQVVKNNVMLFRNIKSKDAPSGEFVISPQKYLDVFSKNDSPAQLLLQNTFESTYYKSLFGLNLDLSNKTPINRQLNAGISIATPYTVAMQKSICGDKKDNIFPIFGWKLGDKNYKVTPKMIEKSLKTQGLLPTEKTFRELFTDKDALITLLLDLKQSTKQTVNISNVIAHLKHNFLINILSVKNIPEEHVAQFLSDWKTNFVYFENKFNVTPLKVQNLNKKDNAVNLLENSIPDII
jgi:hypothetical protein